MFQKVYDNIPTFVEAGESAAAKTATAARMVRKDFVEGMEVLTGDGMTTSCETEVIIDPEEECASIMLELSSSDEIREKVIKNIQTALLTECKNVVSSLPENNEDAFKQFVENAVENRARFQDEKFRVHRLLVNRKEEYHKYLEQIFDVVLAKAAEPVFRRNCRDAAKEAKIEASRLIEQLICNMLDTDACKKAIEELIGLIQSEVQSICEREMTCPSGADRESLAFTELDSERFKNVVKVISNSTKKELEKTASIACVIKSMSLVVPGLGIITEQGYTAYRMIDIVGFTNDGLREVNSLVSKAVLPRYNYDGIIYFASMKAINKLHESFLADICESMRPAKLILISTFMDKDAVFDEDEEPTVEMLQQLNQERIAELLDVVNRVAGDDLHIVLPTEEDVICISNKVSLKKHGEAALEIYSDKQYELIRQALSRAVNTVRRKICVGVDRTAHYLVPANKIEQITGQIINQLGRTIDAEYGKLRDCSGQIHHWTLDAVLWNLLSGKEHVSNAYVWKNVHITTFSDMQRICLENLGEFKFSAEVKVGRQEDSIRIKKEFMANLSMRIYLVVRRLILTEPGDGREDSMYRKQLRSLAWESKYNKWKIIDDLRLCLMNAVTQPEYLKQMLQEAMDAALLTTYDKILY